jgi:ribonuclease PH
MLATSLNSTFAALLDAGVPLSLSCAAVSCVVNQKGEVSLDPTAHEEDVTLSRRPIDAAVCCLDHHSSFLHPKGRCSHDGGQRVFDADKVAAQEST